MNNESDLKFLSSELTEIQEIMKSVDENEGLLIADGEGIKKNIYEKVLMKVDNLRDNIKDSNIRISGFTVSFTPIIINSSFSINFEIKE